MTLDLFARARRLAVALKAAGYPEQGAALVGYVAQTGVPVRVPGETTPVLVQYDRTGTLEARVDGTTVATERGAVVTPQAGTEHREPMRSFRASDELWTLAEKKAADAGVSRSAFVRLALERACAGAGEQ